ncbi:MAG TPA: hypothetical protein VFP19_02885, partial [Candidatus Limnocylindrales bacterium]|nr:hypothetical protein [Candidatus Limnocylindrales bacterium]
MATAQKRGFRFPWGGDDRHDEPPSDAEEGHALDRAGLTQRIGAQADDLGAGPFGVSGSGPLADVAEPVGDEAADAVDLDLERAAWPQSDRGTAGPLAGSTRRRADKTDEAAEPAAPDDHEEPAPMMSATAAAEDDLAAEEPTEAAVVEATTAETPRQPAPPAPVTTRTADRKTNPLMAGLVRAMRDAAKTARDETVATLHVDAATRADAIRAQAATAVNDLKKIAEADVAGIKEWSRQELARVREETEERIAARRSQLVDETEAAGRASDDLLASLHTAVEAFEAEMGRFFDALLAEEDPARLAGLAERMPAPPTLDGFPAAGDATVVARPEPMPAAVAHPAPATEPEPEPDAEASVAEATQPQAEVAAPEPEQDDPRAGWLDHLDPDAAAAAEAEAL